MHRRVPHADKGLVGEGVGPGVAPGFLAEACGGFPVMHEAHQDAVLDEGHVRCLHPLVVAVHGKGRGFSEGLAGEVRHAHQGGGDDLVQVGAAYAAPDHQVRLHSMAHRLVGQHAAELTPQDAGEFARPGVDPLPLVHKLGVELLHLRAQGHGIPEPVVKAAEAAEGLEELHRGPFLRFGGEVHVNVTAGDGGMGLRPVPGEEMLLRAVAEDHQTAAHQIRQTGDPAVQLPQVVQIGLLLRVFPLNGGGDEGAGDGLPGRLAFVQVPIQYGGVVLRALQHGPQSLPAHLRGGGKAVGACPADPGGDAAHFAPLVCHRAAGQEHHPPVPVQLCPQLSLLPCGDQGGEISGNDQIHQCRNILSSQIHGSSNVVIRTPTFSDPTEAAASLGRGGAIGRMRASAALAKSAETTPARFTTTNRRGPRPA